MNRFLTIPVEYHKIDNIVVTGVDRSDHPDYSDACIESADYDGTPMTDEELDSLDMDWVHGQILEWIFG